MNKPSLVPQRKKQKDFRNTPEMSQTMSKLEQLKTIKDRIGENTCLANNDFLEFLITEGLFLIFFFVETCII